MTAAKAVSISSAPVTSALTDVIPVNVLRDIPIAQLFPSLANPRREMDDASLDELATSILAHGIQSPLLVRPKPGQEDEGRFEIVAGHRRYYAAARANLGVVPCIARDLSDDEAAEVALIDNLQRVDIPPMDEAQAFGELRDRLLSIEAVAAKVGKEMAYVAKALKLLSLSEASRSALAAKLITIDHARLLCRLAELEQNAALKWCLDPHAGVKVAVEDVITKRLERSKEDDEDEDDEEEQGPERPRWRRTWEPQSVQELKDHIETESGTPLDRAPWPLTEDWLIPDAGACADCEKNTKANAPLFGDLDTGVAVCTDGGCFKAKTQAFVQIELRKAAMAIGKAESEDGQPKLAAISLSWKSTSTPPRLDKETGLPSLKQVFKCGQWMDIGPKGTKCEHARPGVTVDWDEPGYNNGRKLRKPGEVIQVCIQPKCKVHKKAYEKQASSASGGGRGESYEQQRAREKKELDAFKPRELPVRRALYDAIVTKLSGDALKRFLLRAASAASVCLATGFESEDWHKRVKYAEGLVAKAKGAELDHLLIASELGSELDVSHHEVNAADRGRSTLRKVAKELGLDPLAIERAAEKAIAPPKAEVAKPAKATLKPAAAKAPTKKVAAKKPSPKKAAKKAAHK
jgi:ParB/RepB/Spo0J family partition protein